MTRPRRVPSLLPLLSVATLLGVKFLTVERAARSGRLRVRASIRKVGGNSRPLVSIRDVAAFAREMVAMIDAKDPELRQTTMANQKRMRARLVAALKRIPGETVELEEVVGGG